MGILRVIPDNPSFRPLTESFMEAPLQFLRDLLHLKRPAPADQKAVAEVRAWLDATAGDPIATVVDKLTVQIIPAIASQPNLHMRFKLLEEARLGAERTLPVFEHHVAQALLPLPMEAGSSALAADNLLRTLADAYQGMVSDIQSQKLKDGLGYLLQQTIRRTMQMLVRRQLLAYRIYARPAAATWHLLHDLYRLARQEGACGAAGEEQSIEDAYLGSLLLAYFDPGRLPRRDIGAIRDYVAGLVPLARISEADPGIDALRGIPGCFLLDPDEGNPGRHLVRSQHTTTSGKLFVDCRPVIEALDRDLRRYAVEGPDAAVGLAESVVHTLRLSLGGQTARRFNRNRFKPRADLVAGLDPVLAFMNGQIHSRRAGDAGKGGTDAVPVSEWALLDESPDGFGLRYLKGEKWSLGAGELAALRPKEQGRIHLCLVRRIASVDHRGLELGLQELSPQATLVDFTVDMDSPGDQGILLPRLPGYGNQPGLIARPGRLQPGSRITAMQGERPVTLAIAGRIEANSSLEFFLLDPLRH